MLPVLPALLLLGASNCSKGPVCDGSSPCPPDAEFCVDGFCSPLPAEGEGEPSTIDLDGDGLSNADEGRLGTRFDNDDSDGDGQGDGEEVGSGNPPLDADNDGLIDALESSLDIDGDGDDDEHNACAPDPRSQACCDLDVFGADIDGDCDPDLAVGSPGVANDGPSEAPDAAIVQFFSDGDEGGLRFPSQLLALQLPEHADEPESAFGAALALDPVRRGGFGRRGIFAVDLKTPTSDVPGLYWLSPTVVDQAGCPAPGSNPSESCAASASLAAAPSSVAAVALLNEETFIAVGIPGDGGGLGQLVFFRVVGTLLQAAGELRGVDLPATSGTDFGATMARIGDLNGDGTPEIAVSAGTLSGSNGLLGVLLLDPLGCPGAPGCAPDVRGAALFGSLVPPPGAPSGFGQAIANAGDIDNDGADDIAIGADDAVFLALSGRNLAARSPTNQFSDYVELLPPDGFDAGARFGSAIAGIGDVDGDSFGDLLVGAPFHRAGGGILPECAELPGAPPGYAGDCAGAVVLIQGVALADAASAPSGGVVQTGCFRPGLIGDVYGTSLRALRGRPGRADIAVGAPSLPAREGSVEIVKLGGVNCSLVPLGARLQGETPLSGDRFGAALGQ